MWSVESYFSTVLNIQFSKFELYDKYTLEFFSKLGFNFFVTIDVCSCIGKTTWFSQAQLGGGDISVIKEVARVSSTTDQLTYTRDTGGLVELNHDDYILQIKDIVSPFKAN